MRQGKKRSTNAALLQGLSEAELKEVLSYCTRRVFQKDEQIVRHMDTDNNIYFVETGLLGVAQISDSGREVGYIELQPGDIFGELSVIDGGPRSAGVTALCESHVTVMPNSTFMNLTETNPAVCFLLMQHLVAIIRRLSERVYEVSTLSVDSRVHAELLRIARKHIDLDGVARIPSPPTHAQLASRISCNREAVSRELKRLEKKGILLKQDRRWIIPDFQQLQKMVDEVHRI